MRIRRLLSSLKKRLTCLYAKTGRYGKIEEVSEYSAAGISMDVYWYDSDSTRAGHCTPLRTILMNKQPFTELSQKARDYVFLHEAGHAKMPVPLTIIMYILLIPAIIFAFLSPIAALLQLSITWLSTNSLMLTSITLLAGVFVIAVFTGLFSLVSWFSEGYAELFALNKLGRSEYLEISEELKEYADRGLIRRTLHRIQYPPPRLVVWTSKKI